MSRMHDSSASQRGRLLFLFSNPRQLVGALLAFVLACGMESSKAAAQCTAPDYCGQVATFTQPTQAEGNGFGTAAAIDNDVLAISSLEPEEVYIYREVAGQWSLETTLIPPQPDDLGFGAAVALQGNVLVVGAYNAQQRGAAFVYRWNGNTWVQEAKLTAPGNHSHFGISVSIDGDVIAVGSGSVGCSAPFCGGVYVFRFDGTSWNQESSLSASGPASNEFGSS